jgi:hypothetical protein
MRRRLDVLLVASVAAIGLLAVSDSLRPGPSPTEPAVARQPFTPALARQARALGATGEILFSDADCVHRRLELPELELSVIRRIVGCSVFGHRGSLGIVRGEVGWYAYPGGVTMLLTRSQLAREAERELGVRTVRVVAAAWLRNTRYAALLEVPGRQERVLALFEADRLIRHVAELPAYRELRSSPRGGWFAALDGKGGLALYDAEGERVTLPPGLEGPHAIAWSRDDRLAAVAVGDGLALFATGSPNPVPVRLDVPVLDLAWRR